MWELSASENFRVFVTPFTLSRLTSKLWVWSTEKSCVATAVPNFAYNSKKASATEI